MTGGTHHNGQPNPAGVTTDPARIELMAGWDASRIAAENKKIIDANALVPQDSDGAFAWTSLFPSPAPSRAGSNPPSGSVTPGGSRKESAASQALAALFSGVDPARLKLALDLLAAGNRPLATSPLVPASATAITPRMLTMAGASKPSQSEFEAPRVTHPLVLELLDFSRYIPLTLFTAAARTRLLLQSEDLRKVQIRHNEKKHFVLDVSQFGTEDGLSEAHWRQATKSFMVCIGTRGDTAVQAFFEEHFAFLEGREEVSELFQVTLRVDILLRRQWFAKCYTFEEPFYHQTWNNAKNDYRFERARTVSASPAQGTSSAGGGGGGKAPRAKFGPGDRHSPYSTPHPSTLATDGGGSFRPKGNPLCVLCIREGHTAYDCKESKTVVGKDLYCRYDAQERKVITKQHGDRVCLFWNISSNRCSTTHPDGSKHICSLCGSASHSARSRACAP
jgi:hypothetical protein